MHSPTKVAPPAVAMEKTWQRKAQSGASLFTSDLNRAMQRHIDEGSWSEEVWRERDCLGGGVDPGASAGRRSGPRECSQPCRDPCWVCRGMDPSCPVSSLSQ